MSLAEIQNQHARGAILGLLDDGNKANDSVLHQALTMSEGVNVSRDQARAALRWLGEQGLIRIETVGSYLVAQISERGQDFNHGRVFVDGIKRRLG